MNQYDFAPSSPQPLPDSVWVLLAFVAGLLLLALVR